MEKTDEELDTWMRASRRAEVAGRRGRDWTGLDWTGQWTPGREGLRESVKARSRFRPQKNVTR
ncbi:hypothetical protein ASPZODRAFT_126842 [Penicilliopsis zonata CBS 506.65]|uniref:Uncharacterized protein n=1 Tax=Penicilliopsis zonata CBS 506.65 TaxID=1073090 RepID=A0A1L9SUL5_9EURO|nr:hypothetical protein ASPZODRAFT_126842 [Penicilliopsis zonata CBS 506.65]OJJ50879.1 hypothetical protein ASPZODRAFT_126842 [Penicilliopsis zonata CBS 506.65]